MKDDIIRMAREAGLCDEEGRDDSSVIIENHLKRFAALLLADEREACAQLVEEMGEERKRTDKHIWAALEMAAENIRARGQDPMPLFDDWPGGWRK